MSGEGYRKLALVGPGLMGPGLMAEVKEEPPLKAGLLAKCPSCQYSDNAFKHFFAPGPYGNVLTMRARLCVPHRRVRLVGWLWWSRRCERSGVHVHQKCPSCGTRWVRGLPTEEVFE